MVELWLKIVQVGCPALEAYSRITYGPLHKIFAHPYPRLQIAAHLELFKACKEL